LSQRPTEAKGFQVEQNDGLLNADLVENARILSDYERLKNHEHDLCRHDSLNAATISENRRTWQPETA